MNKKTWLVFLRICLGLVMTYNGRYIFWYGHDVFWHDYFKNVLHFPFPNLMFYLAKGSEFFGGLLLLFGLMTRIAAGFLACTMLVATLFANIQNIYGGFGSITLSYFIFSLIFMMGTPGPWSIDDWISSKKNRGLAIRPVRQSRGQHNLILFFIIRLWFGSILIVDCIKSAMANNRSIFFDRVFKTDNIRIAQDLYWVAFTTQMITGLFIICGLLRKISAPALAFIMLSTIAVSIFGESDLGGYYFLMSVILFWFACVLSVDAIYKPSAS